MEFGPSQSPAPTPPRPLHRWANEGRGVGTMLAQLYRWPNPVGAWPLCTPNLDGGQGPGAKHPLGTAQLALEGCTHHQLCSWVWLGQATQWWVGPSDTT